MLLITTEKIYQGDGMHTRNINKQIDLIKQNSYESYEIQQWAEWKLARIDEPLAKLVSVQDE